MKAAGFLIEVSRKAPSPSIAAPVPMNQTTVQTRASHSELQEARRVRHYTWQQRLVSWFSMSLFDSATYTVRHGLLKGMKRKGGLGWLPAALSPGTSTAEERFWSGIDLAGMTVYDVGAFQGLLTLFFSLRAKRVVCFEPHQRNHKRLVENLALNGVKNVEVRKVGVGSRPETRKLVGSVLMSGGATVDERRAADLRRERIKTSMQEIPIVALDDEIASAGLPVPDFIKIDIEGWELEALRGAANILKFCQPALFLEMHGETILEKKRKAAEIVDFLWDRNYRRIRHIETGVSITPDNTARAMEGHLYCRSY
jgi:FkbM family methyltransferase